MKARLIVALLVVIAGTVLAASTGAPEASVGVIEPVPPVQAADGGR